MWDNMEVVNNIADYYVGRRSTFPIIPSHCNADLLCGMAREQAQSMRRNEIVDAISQAEYNRQWAEKWGQRARNAGLISAHGMSLRIR